jgi:hypothetical protein
MAETTSSTYVPIMNKKFWGKWAISILFGAFGGALMGILLGDFLLALGYFPIWTAVTYAGILIFFPD